MFGKRSEGSAALAAPTLVQPESALADTPAPKAVSKPAKEQPMTLPPAAPRRGV